jgi:predicted nucleotidyltransferase
MELIIEHNRQEIIDLCKKHKVSVFHLFGSAARSEMKNDSDIDFLVTFSDEIALLDYSDNYFSLKFALENLLKKSVDLVSLKSLKNPILLEEINNSKVELYAA